MKAIFMGTPDFAVPMLNTLIEMEYEIPYVVTRADKPKGRGQKVVFTPIKEEALKHNIPVLQPERVKNNLEFINIIKEAAPDIIIVVAYGRILPLEILNIPKYGCINVHGSLLPKYRGSAPIQWSIINGEAVTGVTTMFLDEGMDTGDMILKSSVPILPSDTSDTLYDKLALEGAKVLRDTLKLIEEGKAPREKQNESEATYAPMIEKSIGLIDWNNQAVKIRNLIMGTNPWPGAYTYLEGKTYKIFDVEILKEASSGNAGEIVRTEKDALVVSTGDYNIAIKELQMEGKKRMNVGDYLKGHEVLAGTCFKITLESN